MKTLHAYLPNDGQDISVMKDSLESLGLPIFWVKQKGGAYLYDYGVGVWDYSNSTHKSAWGKQRVMALIKELQSETYVSPFDGQRK